MSRYCLIFLVDRTAFVGPVFVGTYETCLSPFAGSTWRVVVSILATWEKSYIGEKLFSV